MDAVYKLQLILIGLCLVYGVGVIIFERSNKMLNRWDFATCIGIIFALLFGSGFLEFLFHSTAAAIVNFIIWLGITTFTIRVFVQRLRDAGLTKYLAIFALFPIANLILLVALFLIPTEERVEEVL